MRVLLAGLFVYIGLMFSVGYLSENQWFENASPVFISIALFFVIFALVVIAFRLFNKRDDSPNTFEEIEDIDPSASWNFRFTSTTKYLLDAEKAERQEVSGMNGFFRGAVILMGVMWVFLPILLFDSIKTFWQPLISELFGIAVLYKFVIKPTIMRRQIRGIEPESQNVEVNVGVNGFQITSDGEQMYRSWGDLEGVLNTSSGMLFYWIDGTKSWLPINIIGSKEEYWRLAKYVFNRSDCSIAP